MKFLPVLEPGDSFKTSEGKQRTCWKVVILYVDSEGQSHEDVEPIEPVADLKSCDQGYHDFQQNIMNSSGCFSCGVEFDLL